MYIQLTVLTVLGIQFHIGKCIHIVRNLHLPASQTEVLWLLNTCPQHTSPSSNNSYHASVLFSLTVLGV